MTTGNVELTSEVATEAQAPEGIADVSKTESTEVTESVTSEVSNSDWKTSLSEDLRSEASLKDFKDINSLAKSYSHLVKLQGNSIRIPGEDASAEAREEFYNKLTKVEGVVRLPNDEDPDSMKAFYDRMGRPQTTDDYKIPEIENIQFNDDALKGFKELAHNNGLNNDQLKATLEFYAQEKLQETNKHNSMVEENTATLKKIWGDDFNNRTMGAKNALEIYRETYGDAVDDLLQSEAGSNPIVINALADLYGSLKEKGTIQGKAQIQYGTSPAEAREQIAEIRNNPEKMKIYRNPTHPDHKHLVSKMEGLYKAATQG